MIQEFKFFQGYTEHNDVEWWMEDDVVEAMTPDRNVIQNNVLYDRIQFLENQNVRLTRENMNLYLENRRLTNR